MNSRKYLKHIGLQAIIVLAFLQISFSLTAQNPGPAQEKFYNSFSSAYLKISTPPLGNYFVNLDNAIKFSFATENEFFVPALFELREGHKLSDIDASDSLYRFVIKKLLAEKLWGNYGEIYAANEKAFKGYNEVLCECITANYKVKDDISSLMPTVQQCAGNIVKDTVAVNKIRLAAGDKTLDDIFKNQQYFSLFIYQNCPVVTQSMNEILRLQANIAYTSTLAIAKGKFAQKVLEYYRDRKVDSLKRIFPGYQKYVAQLNAALGVSRGKGVKYRGHYSPMSAGSDQPAVVSFFSAEAQHGDLEISFANPGINAVVTKIVFRKMNLRNDESMQIMEIREDTAVPKKN